MFLDGDYLDISINDMEIFTLVVLYDEMEHQINNLMKNDTCDLSNIPWPRRADGSMDYPPLVDMSAYQTTHRTIDRLRLRNEASTLAMVVTTLENGTEVQVLETGPAMTIDGITANWVKVLSSTQYSGWCFSGYLEQVATEINYQDNALGNNDMFNETEISTNQVDKAKIPLLLILVIIGGIVIAGGIVAFVLKRKK